MSGFFAAITLVGGAALLLLLWLYALKAAITWDDRTRRVKRAEGVVRYGLHGAGLVDKVFALENLEDARRHRRRAPLWLLDQVREHRAERRRIERATERLRKEVRSTPHQ